jgi:hypothetical protein
LRLLGFWKVVKRRTKKHFPVLDLELPAGKVPLKLWHWGKASIILTNNIKIVNCFVMLFVTAGNASLEVAANALVALLDSRSLSQVRFHRNKLVTELLDLFGEHLPFQSCNQTKEHMSRIQANPYPSSQFCVSSRLFLRQKSP